VIVFLKSDTSHQSAQELASAAEAFLISGPDGFVLINSSSVKNLPLPLEAHTRDFLVFTDDLQLGSKKYQKETREIPLGQFTIGGNSGNTVVMSGPCSVESKAQIESAATLVKDLGLQVLRAGAFKPRTSPYTFQGLGLSGLELLSEMRQRFGLTIISEIRDGSHVDDVIAHADILQIGAKSMYDHAILKACGKSGKPVLIKRGFGTTLQELVQAAEFVLSLGNPNVMLCERGIRTFETKTRFTLDLCGVAWLKEHTNFPVVLDPSHAMGYAYGVPDLARACVAMGVDALLIEVHPDPSKALSDASQQLNHSEFRQLIASLHPIATAVGKRIC
jgi:3-deoxy-7-phosphoheptulonate synthase